ncbi:MAG: sensor histidine kinase [Mycobacteriales bacterium]
MRVPRERLLQVGFPLAIVAFGLLETLVAPIRPVAVSAAMSIVAPVPLLARYRFPTAAAITSVTGVLVSAMLGIDLSQPIAPVVVLGLAAYGLGARLPLRRAILTGVVLVCLITSSELVEGSVKGSDPIFGAVLTFGALSMGRVLQTRFDALQAAAAAAREVAVAQERTRIARELHDLIAHSLSVMVVQANAAEQVLRTDPGRAEDAVRAVQQAGRAALSETSRLLDLLREGPDESGPQPTLADLDRIARSVPGLDVDVQVADPLPPLPPGAEVSVCRVVQEALTNVLKHSASDQATVTVRPRDGHLEVSVRDDGPARASERLPGGHGVLGMQERVSVYGGWLEAGPARSGGWQVRAAFPLERT